MRILRPSASSIRTTAHSRSFGTTAIRPKDGEDRAPSSAPEHRAYQKSRVANQPVPNTTSTMTGDYPNVGTRPAPPDLLSSVDPNYKPADPYPGKVEHLTGGDMERGPQKPELGVGEMEGITFKVEPLKRTGEDTATKRARLLCSFSRIYIAKTWGLGKVPIMPRSSARKLISNCRSKQKARNPRIRSTPFYVRRRLSGQDDPGTIERV